MNILYLCEEYPPGKNGGIGTMVNVLGRELVKQGHNVYVVGLYPTGYNQSNYEEDNGVKVWRLRYKADLHLFNGSYSFFEKLYLKFYKLSRLQQLDTISSSKRLFKFISHLIEKYNIDIIEMPDWNTFLHNSRGVIHVPPFSVPLVVKLNGSNSYFSKELGTPVNDKIFNAELALLNRADALTSASNYTAGVTKELFGLSKEITTLYNAVNIPAAIEENTPNNKVIFTGALVKKKGILSLLQAWNLVNEKLPSLQLHIYGKGPTDKLKKILSGKASSSVIFHKHVPREILFHELSSAAMAIFPSYSECFSFAPMEAMSVGCPVIYSSRSSGPELIVHKENGLLIDPDDINAIAEAIILLTTDKELRNTIAKAGQKTVVEKFNITLSARDHIAFYKGVIERFRKDSP